MSNERDRIEIYIREDRDVSQRLRLVIRLKHESAIIGAWFEHGGHHRLTLTTNVTISVMFTLLDAIKRTTSMESERGHLKALRWTKLLSAMETGEQMGGDDRDVDLEKAFLDPGSMFATPEQLHDYPGLTREQKIEILRRWAYDASELAVAEEEGMVGGEPSHLARIVSALHALTDGYDVEHSPPTKQEGV